MLPVDLTNFEEDINHQGGRWVQSLLADVRCAKCGAKAVKLTCARVPRQTIALKKDGWRIEVPLAKCDDCGCRRRVLPADLLPGKTYSIPVIEKFAEAYLKGHRGYRSTVARTEAGSYKPHFTTLHGWLGGLGERALDQVRLARHRATINGTPRLAPFTALIQEAENETGSSAARAFSLEVQVAPWKYRSEGRREHLEACLRLLRMAAVIPRHSSGAEPRSLLDLERIGLVGFLMPMLLFRSRIRGTPIQRPSCAPGTYPPDPGGSNDHGSTQNRPLEIRADRGPPRRKAHAPGAPRAPPETHPSTRSVAFRSRTSPLRGHLVPVAAEIPCPGA